MESGPVDSPVVSLEDVLHYGIRLTKQLSRSRVPELVGDSGSSGGDVLLPQAGNVPHPDRLVEGCRDDEVLGQVEHAAHHVVAVSGQDTGDDGRNKRSFLIIKDKR